MVDERTKAVLMLGAILEMSDDVTRASGAIDMQGRLLRLQNSIQKNRARIIGEIRSLKRTAHD